MTRNDFFKTLAYSLRGIEHSEKKRLLDYYGEIFDDKLEEGKTEDEIIAEFGGIGGLSAKILAEYPGALHYRDPAGKVLSCIGLVFLAPFVFAMAVTLFSLVFSFFVVTGALVLSGAAGALLSVPVFPLSGGVGVFQVGMGLFFIGLGVFAFFGSVAFYRLSIFIMKNTFRLYSCVFGKEAV